MISSPLITLDRVSKNYGAVKAVDDVSLEISPGEFFALIGPSGCGKTTLMRLIAGFETPDAGRILIDGQDMAGVPPHRRPVNMMFQSYALFPHMSVERNVAFGLVQAATPRAEIAQRVAELLKLVQLEGMGARKPDQLSGGQRQRVALARALARRPRLVLLDEPLAALDRKLREETQFELMRVQRELGTGFLLVTHDQDEAMVMAQRIAVMRAGRIEQTGAPRVIYEEPVSTFVAGFIGEVNLFEGVVETREDGTGRVRIKGFGSAPDVAFPAGCEIGTSVVVAVRPERMQLVEGGAPGEVVASAYRGDTQVVRVKLASGAVVRISLSGASAPLRIGQQVGVAFPSEAARVLPA